MNYLCILLVLAAACTNALAQETTTATEITAPQSADNPALRAARSEIVTLTKLATDALEKDDLKLCEMFYERMLNIEAPVDEKHGALLLMGRTYEDHHVYSKAIAVYEKFNQLFPSDPKVPEILLKLGRLYRDVGTNQLALDRFYRVLHSVLKINDTQFASYKSEALTAQFEIAETHFLMGNYDQATKIFNMISLLDLAPPDRDRANFKTLYCQFLLNNYGQSIALAQAFIAEFPDSPNLPQTRYVLAAALKASKRPQEALAQTLELLKSEKAGASKDPQGWAYWRKMTGNQIANDFYQHGDFVSALTIYQSLAKLNDAPDWQWPVVYQMGICFERLLLPSRAVEAYQFIADGYKRNQKPGALSPNLIALNEMAQWHIDQLKWQETTATQLHTLLSAPELPDSLKTSSIP